MYKSKTRAHPGFKIEFGLYPIVRYNVYYVRFSLIVNAGRRTLARMIIDI